MAGLRGEMKGSSVDFGFEVARKAGAEEKLGGTHVTQLTGGMQGGNSQLGNAEEKAKEEAVKNYSGARL